MRRQAIYDNPATRRREAYLDGRVWAVVTAEMLSDETVRLYEARMGSPIAAAGPFKPGQLIGPRRALRPYRPVRSAAVKPWGDL